MDEYAALQAYEQGDLLAAIVRVTPAAEALRAGATVASLGAVIELMTASQPAAENRTALGTLGAVADVVKALREAAAPGGDQRVLGKAALAVNELMFGHPANAAAAAAAGAAEALVLAVRGGDAPDQSTLPNALGAMGSLVNRHPARKEAAGAAGAVEAVVAVLRAHPDTEETQRLACNALWGLVFDCDANAARAQSAGARAPVEAARARFPENKGGSTMIQETTGNLLTRL